jgi:hypothetical protein
MEENRVAVQVWTLCRNQLVYAVRGAAHVVESYPVDIAIPAVIAVMDMMSVGDQVGCLEKVQTLFAAWADAVEEKKSEEGRVSSVE